MDKFRYVSYGCCERLTDRIDKVLDIGNLKIFVKGPWTDLDVAAEKCKGRYSFVWRQNASEIVYADDLSGLRTELVDGLKRTQGCHRAIILQEVITQNGNPGRLTDWVAMAKEAAEQFS